MTLSLGLDPGREGGGVLALDGQAIAVMHWKPYQRQRQRYYRLTCVRHTGPVHRLEGLVGPWGVGMALRGYLAPTVALHGGGLLLGCEAAHIGRNAQTGLALAQFGGALVGPLEPWAPGYLARWVQPDSWRKVVFAPRWWSTEAAAQGKAASRTGAQKVMMTRWNPEAHSGVGRTEIDRRMEAAAKGLFLAKRDAAKQVAARVLPALVPGLADLVAKLPSGAAEHVYDAAGVWQWLTA